MKILSKILIAGIVSALLSSLSLAGYAPTSDKNRLWAKTTYLQSADEGVYELVHNAKQNKLFAAVIDKANRERNYGAVNVYDPKTLEQIDTYKMPYRAFSLAQDEVNDVLFVGHTQFMKISRVDTKTGKVLLTSDSLKQDPQTLHENLRHMVYSEKTNELYVTYINLTKQRTTVVKLLVLDAKTLKQKGEVKGAYSARGFGLHLDKSTGKIYTSGSFINEIDPKTKKITKAFNFKDNNTPISNLSDIAIDNTKQRIFASQFASEGEAYGDPANDGLFVFDLKTGKQLKYLKTGDGSLSVQYNPKHEEIYVSNFRSGTLSVVDAKKYEVTNQIKISLFPNMLAQNADGSMLYIGVKEGFNKVWNPYDFVEGAKERIMSLTLDSDKK